MTNHLLPDLHLAAGKHDSPDAGVCLLEAVSLVAGEPFTDHPACVSPVLGAFGRALNDAMPDGERQQLARLVPLLVGSVDPVADQVDGLRCAFFLVSEWTPAWFDLLPDLASHAAVLRGLPAPGSWDDVAGWQSTIAAARGAARGAAGGAARAAAGGAAGDAAWDAAGDAAWNAAGDAAWGAAGGAAWDAARDAARGAARGAARDAARAALKPTSDRLRARAAALFEELVRGRNA